MRRVSVTEAQAKFSSLLKAVEAGEQFIFTENGRDVAEMLAFRDATAVELTDRGMDSLAESQANVPTANQNAAPLIRRVSDENDR
jgi:antitoxin (DNA-binding transcriptional repressor) of toxin-antitoxin stability system